MAKPLLVVPPESAEVDHALLGGPQEGMNVAARSLAVTDDLAAAVDDGGIRIEDPARQGEFAEGSPESAEVDHGGLG